MGEAIVLPFRVQAPDRNQCVARILQRFRLTWEIRINIMSKCVMPSRTVFLMQSSHRNGITLIHNKQEVNISCQLLTS